MHLVSIPFEVYQGNSMKLTKERKTEIGKYAQSKRKNFVCKEETKRKRSKSMKEVWKLHPEWKTDKKRICQVIEMNKTCHTSEIRQKAVSTRKNKNKPWHSEETKKKISKSHIGKVATKETKLKQRIAKLGKPRAGNPENWKHTNEVKQLLREQTLQEWKDGKHKPIWQSKGHLEVFHILKNIFGLECEIEYNVNGKSFDIFVKDKNLLLEFNGTYWHADPRIYNPNDIISKRKILAKEKWKFDEKKISIAINAGYNIKTIWQLDWDNNINKIDFLKDILNEY
jgi:hypothetical protein